MKNTLLALLLLIVASCVNYDDDIKDLNDEIAILKEKNISQDLALDDVNSEIASIKQQQANDVNSLNNRLDLLEQSLDGFNNIVASLQASNTLLNSELASIQSDLSSLTTDVSSLTTDVSSIGTTGVSSIGTTQSVSNTQASINALDSQVSVLSNNLTAALNRISTLEASTNTSSSTASTTTTTTITYTVTETVQLQIDWLRFFVPFGVNDSGFVQRGGSGLAQQGGLTVLFNHTSNQVNFPGLSQFSFPLGEQYRVEDENGNKIELLRTGSNWKASISSSATKIRFLYKYASSPFQLYTTPYIEIKPSYNKFYVSFSADIIYSNITDTW